MSQTLLIGLGGTGSRAVNKVVAKLHKNGKAINDGNICCAVLDTNKEDVALIEGTGTGVPVIATSKNQNIDHYFKDHADKRILDWSPDSPQLRKESMLAGASVVRYKSRIAFMDAMNSGMLRDLQRYVNKVIKDNDNAKISVMLVSSLSGGTGSGMFIQVALWLREQLKAVEYVMRGIFLLPDIFIENVADIKNSKSMTRRHYANAYAAIRELNAISMIRNNGVVELPQSIELDGLFDSADGSQGKPVFDFAFFIDNKDAKGVTLGSIGDYESAVADLVYMQMYAPMTKSMYSEEDNYFIEFSKSIEPLYGSCGTSCAIYPVEDVLEYCKLRAVQDSLTSGWRRIDDEIAALEEEAEQLKKEGYSGDTEIDAATKYIDIFEREIRKHDGRISDPFFAAIADDVVNRKKGNIVDGEMQFTTSPKVKDLIEGIMKDHIETVASIPSLNAQRLLIPVEDFVKSVNTVSDLIDKVTTDRTEFTKIIRNFERVKDKYVDDIVNKIMSYTMKENMEQESDTIMSLFVKLEKKRVVFVHPVAARYMLLKLIKELEQQADKMNPTLAKQKTLADTPDDKPIFDNKKTKDVIESTAMDYLESKRWYQRESGFTDKFEREYAGFINSKVAFCKKYVIESLAEEVYEKLVRRLTELLERFEILFADLKEVREKVKRDLAVAAATKDPGSKNITVYGRPEHKEAVYKTLRIDLSGGRGINKSVITALYGGLCAQKRPNTESNQKYADLSIVDTFIGDAKTVFEDMIIQDPENKGKVYLSIYDAMCKESDYEVKTSESDLVRQQRHYMNLSRMIDALNGLATPFLDYELEEVKRDDGRQLQTKCSWGFSPKLVQQTGNLDAILGVNSAILQSDAYPDNELYCYRAVYCLRAELVPKFNELTGGVYYTSYQSVINEMLEMQKGVWGDKAFVQTPHLDKRWHKILPYITSKMESKDHLAFYRGIWLGIAYGKIVINKDGYFCVNKKVDTGYDSDFVKAVPVMYEGKPVASRDVVKFVEGLKLDADFANSDIPALEARFKNELEDISTYEATAVLKGLKTAKGDLNPIDIVVRYNRNKSSEIKVLGALIGAMESIAQEMAANYHDNSRSEKSIVVAKYKILRKIYDAAILTKEKSEVFAGWLQAFEEHGVKSESATEEATE